MFKIIKLIFIFWLKLLISIRKWTQTDSSQASHRCQEIPLITCLSRLLIIIIIKKGRVRWFNVCLIKICLGKAKQSFDQTQRVAGFQLKKLPPCAVLSSNRFLDKDVTFHLATYPNNHSILATHNFTFLRKMFQF